MAHSAARSDDFSDSYYRGGESLSQNETTPYPYFFGREPENGPPHHNMPVGVPPLGPCCSICAPPWGGAPDLYARVQGLSRDGVSCNAWSDAQHNAPFTAPAMSVVGPYKNQNQDAGSVNGAVGSAYQQQQHPTGRIPARGEDDLHGRYPTATNFRPAYATEYGPTLGTASAHGAALAGAEAHGQPQVYNPHTSGAPEPSMMPSESMKFFARRYVLDPGTRVDDIHMGTGGYGHLKIVITLEVPDGAAAFDALGK